jgi:DNA modification methylase
MALTNYIDIGHTKQCDCKETHLSCVDAKEWARNQVGIWSGAAYEKRDIRDKSVHPAAFPIALATRVIRQYTHVGELVLDPFVGSGTTLVAAQDLARNAVGFDLSQDYVNLSNSRVDSVLNGDATKQIAVCADARDAVSYIAPETVKLVFTSPPYANLLNRPRRNNSRRSALRKNSQYQKVEQYSQDPRDLGTLPAEQFETALCDIFARMRPVLMAKAHIIINITDAWIEGKRYPLHINTINALQKAGYALRNTIIWDRRNLINRIGIFGWPSNYITLGTTFEYILDFTL